MTSPITLTSTILSYWQQALAVFLFTYSVYGSGGPLAFYRLITPPPISPYFSSPASYLYGLNEDLTLTALCMVFLGIIDYFRPALFPNPKSRYFVLHVSANTLVTLSSLPDLHRALVTPVSTSLVGPTLTVLPMCAVVAIHLYHALFFNLSADDLFHHLCFVVPLSLLSVVFKWDGGASQNFGAFFICGLPGGLNYAALAAVKEGWLHSLTQKWFDGWVNVSLRLPGTVVYAFLQWQVWLAGARPSKGWSKEYIAFFTFVVAGLMLWNGIYYGEQSVGNYHAHATRTRLEGGGGRGGGEGGNGGAGGGDGGGSKKADGKKEKEGSSKST